MNTSVTRLDKGGRRSHERSKPTFCDILDFSLVTKALCKSPPSRARWISVHDRPRYDCVGIRFLDVGYEAAVEPFPESLSGNFLCYDRKLRLQR